MIGYLGSIFSGIGLKIALFFLDRALKGIIEGSMTPEMEEKIGEGVDGFVDKFQNAQGEAGKAARIKVVELCDKIKENLLEAD